MTTAFGTDRSSSDSETIAAAVAAAAQAAAAAMPAQIDLRPGNTVADPESVPLPPVPGAAVTAALGGEASGDIVLVLSQEIVDALTNSPVGAMDVATALRPALEAAAGALGRVRVAAERVEDVVAALDGLRDKGVFLAVPLIAAGEVAATLALQVTLPRPRERRGRLGPPRHRGPGGARASGPAPRDRA